MMAISVVMPALELTQESGKLVSWRKKEGEAVAKGETLMEVETDKAVVEVEAQADGFLAGVNAKDGEVIAVGTTIAWIVAKGEAPPESTLTVTSKPTINTKIAQPEKARAASPGDVVSHAKPKISPKARRIAGELNVNLNNVRGSGQDGEILLSDVEAAAKVLSPTPEAPSADRIKLETFTTISRLMAERTAQSWTTVPHFFLVREVEASALLSARENLLSSKVSSGVKITTTDLLTAIVSRVLMRHPRMNASYSPDGIRLHSGVNMGIAIAVNDGVIAAVIPNAHTASITEIATQRRDLVERAKAGKSRAQDLIDATFTISNLGMFSIDSFTAIIPPSQAGILAVGTIADRVVAIDGQPAVRSMMTITLSCDHRVVDGARGALFLDDLANAISKPQEHLGSQL
jgi:pyruvate dehydrogenase E2 component (dihydrolipoyllysine-residue acetyltransferase)